MMKEHAQPPVDASSSGADAGDLRAFKRLRFLDAGAFGSVYAGREDALGHVALKFCAVKDESEGQTAEDRARRKTLEREREVFVKIRREPHPNIIACLATLKHDAKYRYPRRVLEEDSEDHDPEELRIWTFVMERAQCSMITLMTRLGPFDAALARTYCFQLASALAHLHKLKIYHRDLKPDNVLIGLEGNVKLADFGYAATRTSSRMKLREDGTAAVRTRLGTWIYMAPEVSENPLSSGDESEEPYHYDPERADAYGLGLLAFVMITKRHPFDYFAVSSRNQYYYLEGLWRSACEEDRKKYWQFFEGKRSTRHLRYPVYEPHREFIEETMCRDPRERLTVTEALQSHALFAPDAEYVSPEQLATQYGSRMLERSEVFEALVDSEDKEIEVDPLYCDAYKRRNNNGGVSPKASPGSVRHVDTSRDELGVEDVVMKAKTALTTWEDSEVERLNRSAEQADGRA